MKRREALRVLGAAATIPVAAISARDAHALGARIHRGLARRGELPLDGLTAAQKRTVAALAETVIPDTDTLGARTARVDDFIDVLVAEWFDDAERARFVAGVAGVDERARRAFGKAFADGTADEQRSEERRVGK